MSKSTTTPINHDASVALTSEALESLGIEAGAAERVEFMAPVQKGLDQLDRGEGIPHDEVKRQLASWLTS